MSAPYDEAAEVYLASGLWPIPVRGKSLPAAGTTGYEGTVTDAKVAGWLDTDLTRRARAGRGVGLDNVGLRHQGTLAVDVDHGYGDKNGVEQLAAFAARAGLPPLPATWSSTARGDDSPSRQYVYRIDADTTFKTKPCKSVELCCWHHRYTVCAPSVHPDTGSAYTWYLPGEPGVPPTWGEPTPRFPRVEAFAELPAEWANALRGSVANADRSAATIAAPELLATFPQGEPDGLVRHLIETWSDETVHVGHDEAKNGLIHAFLLGREGHPGVHGLVQLLVARLTGYLEVARPGGAMREATALVEACATIAQQKPVRTTVLYLGDKPTPAEFMAGAVPAVPVVIVDDPNGATKEEFDYFLRTYTRFSGPQRLGRRAAWAKTESPDRLTWHARCLVEDVLAGHYPAERALVALADAYRHHGGRSMTAPRQLLSAALGVVLSKKVSA